MEKAIQMHMQMLDGVTSVLQNVTDGLNMTIEVLDGISKASGDAFDVNSINAAREQIKNTELAIQQLGSGIDGNTKSQEKFNNEVENSTREMENLAKKVMATASAYFGIRKGYRELKEGLGIFREYEVQMATVGAVTGASREEMELLNKASKEFAGYYMPKDIAVGFEELARRGWDATDILYGASDVLNLAIGNTMDLGRTAEITADILDGFHYGVDQTNRVVNVLTYAAANASTDVDLLGSSFQEVSAIARTFGADVEDVGAIVSMMASSVKGSKAGRALRIGFLNMANLTDDAEAILKALDVSFIDPVTKGFKDIEDIIGDLHHGFKDLNNAAKLQAAQEIFGTQGANAWLEVIDQGAEGLKKWTDEFKDMGDVALEQAQAIMNTTDGLMREHQADMETNWIEFYERLADIGSIDAFESILNAIESIQQYLLTVAEIAIDVGGTFVNIFGGSLGYILPFMATFAGLIGIFFTVQKAIEGVATAQAFLNMVMEKNPIIFILSLIGALAVALVHLWRTNDNFAIGLMTTWHNVLNFFSGIPASFWSISEGILEGITSWGKPALDFMSGVFNEIIDGVNWVIGALNKIPGVSVDLVSYIDFMGMAENALKKVSDRKDLAIEAADLKAAERELKLNAFIQDRQNQADGIDLDPSLLKGLDGLSGDLEGLGKSLDGIDKKVGGIKDSVDISNEDIKLLRDLAETKIINRFTTQTISPEISLEFLGNIDNETDFEGLVTRLTDEFIDKISSGPEGVYE